MSAGLLDDTLDRFAATLRGAQARFAYVEDTTPEVDTTHTAISTSTAAGDTTPLETIPADESLMPAQLGVRDWPTLPTHIRAEAALGEAYASRQVIGFSQAVGLLYRESQALDEAWLMAATANITANTSAGANAAAHANPNALSETHTPASTEMRSRSPITPDSPQGRQAIAITLYHRLRRDPTIGASIAVTMARDAFERAASGRLDVPSDDDIQAYHANRLADKFRPMLGDTRPMSSLALLRHVHAALAEYFPDHHLDLLDNRVVDIAAALHQRNDVPTPHDSVVSGLHPAYRLDVETELAMRERAARMIPWDSLPPAGDGPWFDGMAMRGVLGKQVTDLISYHATRQLLGIMDQPQAADEMRAATEPAISVKTIEALIRKRLGDLQESTRFPFGMPQQSIDTIVLRLAPLHNVTIANGDDFATVLGNFNRLCAAWSASPKYYISPALSAALHLAHASGVVILHTGPAIPQHVEWTREHYNTLWDLADDPAPFSALTRWENARRETIWQTLPRLAADLANPPDPSIPELAQRIIQAYRSRAQAAETIVADTKDEVEKQLLDYFHMRLRAYKPLPSFNEDRALLDMWKRQYGVSEAWLNTTRAFPCLESGDFLASFRRSVCHGTSLQELSVRERSLGSYQEMEIGRHRFDATDERDKALPFYRQTLATHPIALARSAEILRMAGKPFTSADMTGIAQRLAQVSIDDKTGSALDFFLSIMRSITTFGWPMHIAETISRGDPKEILSLLPFIVPAYEIEEGIRHGEGSRALRGGFQFGVDALMTWIGGKIDARLALPAELPAIQDGERIALSMLNEGLATLGEPRRMALPLSEAIEPVAGPSGVLPAAEAPRTVPLRFAHLSERVRGGAIVPVDLGNVPNARMAYLPSEDRILTFARTHSTIWELTWDGHIIGELTDQRLGQIRESFWHAFPDSLPATALTRETLMQRPTVAATAEWIDNAGTQTSVVEDMTLGQAMRELKTIVDANPLNSPAYDIFYALSTMYRQSRTLRWIVGQAPRSQRGERGVLRLKVEPGAAAEYRRATHTLIVPPASEIEEIEYLSRNGPTHFQRKSVWLHEFIHAMTLLDDPARNLAAEHRGPVVYLTDRILFETNQLHPHRIVYAGPSRRASAAERALPEWQDQARAVVHEDMLLDEKLAAKVPMTPKTPVLGTAVKHRSTVEAAVKIEGAVLETLDGEEIGTSEPFASRLLRRLGPAYPLTGPRAPQVQWLREFVNDARTLYQSSPWAQAFLDGWLRQTSGKRWSIQMRSLLKGEQIAQPLHVSMADARIEIATSNTFSYLSATGPRPYSNLRRVASVLARIGTPHRVVATTFDRQLERGAVVYVEDKLLGLTTISDERRVSAQVWNVRAEDCDGDPTAARRVAADEDRYLEECKPDASGGCLRRMYMR